MPPPPPNKNLSSNRGCITSPSLPRRNGSWRKLIPTIGHTKATTILVKSTEQVPALSGSTYLTCSCIASLSYLRDSRVRVFISRHSYSTPPAAPISPSPPPPLSLCRSRARGPCAHLASQVFSRAIAVSEDPASLQARIPARTVWLSSSTKCVNLCSSCSCRLLPPPKTPSCKGKRREQSEYVCKSCHQKMSTTKVC